MPLSHSQRRASLPRLTFAASLAACFSLTLLARAARANDGMFPAAPAAKSSIDFDGRGFLVHGKRTFLVSAGLEYARIPRALWQDRLLRIKRAGFNTVEIYVFWNFHEPQEGKWNFAGDHDLDAFLKLVNAMGLYATVRVGPYVCAEWDSGGYPVWLRFKPGVALREPNGPFETYVDRYFDKVMPIVAANQINRGGSVVMVQLENEHPKGWGTEMPNEYFHHLRDKALALGLQVPYFFIGLHHGSDPSGNTSWDSAGRTNPWYSTEFWCDWYDKYGNPTPRDTTFEDRATWKILAYGGNGYNYYMVHGGTNFGHFNDNEDASSYDYGAAIGQGGDLRGTYYKFKRAAYFATSFAEILENSTNATGQYASASTNPAIRVTARTSPAGTIVFLDNPTSALVETRLKLPGHSEPTSDFGALFRVNPGEIMPVVLDYKMVLGITLKTSGARILGILPQGDITSLIVYGPAGTEGGLTFQVGSTNYPVSVRFDNAVTEIRTFSLEGKTVRIVPVTSEQADRTYFVAASDRNYVVQGARYVGAVETVNGHLQITTETPGTAGHTPQAVPIVYGPGKEPMTAQFTARAARAETSPVLSGWETRSAADEAQTAFDDKAWLASLTPLPMGADGDDGAYAWYRTTVRAPRAGSYTLNASSVRDRMYVFVDGARVAQANIKGNAARLDLTPGDHTVAILAAHYGRDKLFGLLGPIDKVDAKGLTGPASLLRTAGTAAVVEGWRYRMATGESHAAIPSPDATGWMPATIGADVFDKKRGFAWYQATLPAQPAGAASSVLRFESVDDNATVFLNGVQIGQHAGWNESFDVPLSTAVAGQPNLLTILVENTDNSGGLAGPVSMTSYVYNAPIMSWRMRGGTTDPLTATGWQPLGTTVADGPRLYRATFTAAPPAATGAHPILRATFAGLSHGFLYLNGHNLGRYPEKVPINGIYLPEPWLKGVGNVLTILDEEGNTPVGVTIETEAAATRTVELLEAQ